MSPRVMHAGVASAVGSLANLEQWHRASDLSSITSSGGAVSQWSDKSGNARHATQGTGTLQPTTGVTTLNGKNVIDFADDFLVAATAALHSNTRGFTLFAVTTFPDTLHIASRYDAGTDRREWAWGTSVGDAVFRYSEDGINFNNLHTTTTWASGWALLRLRWTPGGSFEQAVRTTGESSTSPTVSALHTSNVPTEIGRYNLSSTGTFSLAEFVAVSDYVDGQALTDTEAELSSEWGLTLV